MVTKRRKRSKSKKRKTRSTPKRTELDIFDEQLNQFALIVREDFDQILRNTGMTNEELQSFIKNNNYEALKKLPNLKISEPILNQMIIKFKKWDSMIVLRERFKKAQDKMFISALEKKTQQMEEQIKKQEEQDNFYTDLPDKQGFVQMKQKYHAEKEFWEGEKAKAEALLAIDEEDRLGLAGVEEAKRELKILTKKRNWARAKNIQPNIQKWTGKVSKVINTVQDSVQEITKPFAEAGKAGSSGHAGNTDYEKMFSPEHIFDTGKKKKSVEESFGAGF